MYICTHIYISISHRFILSKYAYLNLAVSWRASYKSELKDAVMNWNLNLQDIPEASCIHSATLIKISWHHTTLHYLKNIRHDVMQYNIRQMLYTAYTCMHIIRCALHNSWNPENHMHDIFKSYGFGNFLKSWIMQYECLTLRQYLKQYVEICLRFSPNMMLKTG